MGNESKKKTSIDAAQQELADLAAQARRMWARIRELGEEQDEPLTEAQARGLEPESLAAFIASWLTTTGDTPLEDLSDRLENLARLRQEDIDLVWKARLPVSLAELASSRLVHVKEAAEEVIDAASEDDAPRLAAATEDLCRQMEDGGGELDDLAAHGRRYLAQKA